MRRSAVVSREAAAELERKMFKIISGRLEKELRVINLRAKMASSTT